VEDLKPLAQAPQDRDGVLDARLVHQDGLEPAFQGGVGLDVLAVLVEGRRADHVQLAAGEHRLEHVARVHRALGRPRADHGVQLVDEEQDPALGRLDLAQDRLEPLLELAAVLGPGDQRPHVEREHRLLAQPLGDVAAQDPLGQPLDDGGLADARVADEDRVVLGFAAQDLDHPADLGVPADHRVQLVGPRLGDQVAAVLLKRLVGGFGSGRGDPLVAAYPGEGVEEGVAGDAALLQAPPGGSGRTLLDQRQHEVLDRHVLVLESPGLAFGPVQEPGEALGDHDLPRAGARSGGARPLGQIGAQVGVQRLDVGAGLRDEPGHQALGLVEQRDEQVLAVDLGVAEPHRDALRLLQCFLGLLGEPVHVHGVCSLPGCPLRRSAASNCSIRSSRSSTRPMAA
jgi:hypothetical protein